MLRGIRALFKKKSDREESPENSGVGRRNGCEITSGNVTRYGIYKTISICARAVSMQVSIRFIVVIVGAGATSKWPRVGP